MLFVFEYLQNIFILNNIIMSYKKPFDPSLLDYLIADKKYKNTTSKSKSDYKIKNNSGGSLNDYICKSKSNPELYQKHTTKQPSSYQYNSSKEQKTNNKYTTRDTIKKTAGGTVSKKNLIEEPDTYKHYWYKKNTKHVKNYNKDYYQQHKEEHKKKMREKYQKKVKKSETQK
jgi:hypothetical protein